ncbi:MAG: LysM peptidoglycan-binding domain-containing protein [Actinobacteria bacterium]|nr:LysM peptidoglycan-binding domain-containing protein [Actinomycetota bacterium]
MGRTRVRRRRLGAGLIVLGAAAALAGPALHPMPEARPASARSYVVRPGDTLWSIASSIVGSTEDPRPLVDALRRSNGADPGALVPGQTLVIPVGA